MYSKNLNKTAERPRCCSTEFPSLGLFNRGKIQLQTFFFCSSHFSTIHSGQLLQNTKCSNILQCSQELKNNILKLLSRYCILNMSNFQIIRPSCAPYILPCALFLIPILNCDKCEGLSIIFVLSSHLLSQSQ